MTEVTYWSGKPERIPGHPDPKVKLAKEWLEPKKQNFDTSLSLCDVRLRFEHQGEELVRELNLDTAIASAGYKSHGRFVTRETFATHEAGIVVSRNAGGQAGSVSFSLRVEGRTPVFAATITNGDTE